MAWPNKLTQGLDPHCRTCEVALIRDENWLKCYYASDHVVYLCTPCSRAKSKRSYTPVAKEPPSTLAMMIQKQAASICHGIKKRLRRSQKPKDDFHTMAFIKAALAHVIGSNCPICDQPFKLPNINTNDTQASPNSISVDCFEPAKGYTKSNARFICFECNSRKGNNDLASIKRIYEWMLIGGPDALTPPNCTP